MGGIVIRAEFRNAIARVCAPVTIVSTMVPPAVAGLRPRLMCSFGG